MMATVPHVTSGSGLRKFQTDGFLLDRVCFNLTTFLISLNVFLPAETFSTFPCHRIWLWIFSFFLSFLLSFFSFLFLCVFLFPPPPPPPPGCKLNCLVRKPIGCSRKRSRESDCDVKKEPLSPATENFPYCKQGTSSACLTAEQCERFIRSFALEQLQFEGGRGIKGVPGGM